MPSTYAHYRFGLEVVKKLEEMEKEVTDAYGCDFTDFQ